MRHKKLLLLALLTLSTVNLSMGSEPSAASDRAQSEGVAPSGAIAEDVRSSLSENDAEAERLREEEFKTWFSVNLQRIKTNPNVYTKTLIVTPSAENIKKAHS